MHAFEILSLGAQGHGKSTFNWNLLTNVKLHNPGLKVQDNYLYTNNARIHLSDAPSHIENFGYAVSGILNADHLNIVLDVNDFEHDQIHFLLKIALKIFRGRISLLINKMDEVNWSEEAYSEVVAKTQSHIFEEDRLRIEYIPISSRTGANFFKPSDLSQWYKGQAVYEHWKRALQSKKREVKKSNAVIAVNSTFPIKDRYFAQGLLLRGKVKKGDTLTLLPNRNKVQVDCLYVYDKEVQQAQEGQGLTIGLKEPMEGQFLVKDPLDFQVASRMTSHIYLWGPELEEKSTYLLKHFSKTYQCQIDKIHSQNRVIGPVSECVVDIVVSPNITYKRVDQDVHMGTFALINEKDHQAVALGLL